MLKHICPKNNIKDKVVQMIKFPKEKHLEFKNYKLMNKNPFVLYADFESILEK